MKWARINFVSQALIITLKKMHGRLTLENFRSPPSLALQSEGGRAGAWECFCVHFYLKVAQDIEKNAHF